MALFIDLDNTLIINPLGRYVMPKIYRLAADIIGKGFEEVAEIFKSKHIERIRTGSPKAYDWDDILYEVIGSRERIATNFLEELKRVCDKAVILDKAPEILKILREKGFYLILSTNGLWKYQECVLRETGLTEFFDEIITPDRKGCIKSSREFYNIALEFSEKISVGDNIVFDVYYPKLYKLKAIYVKRSDYVNEIYGQVLGIRIDQIVPDAVISSLSQLPNALEAILPKRR